MKGRIIVGALLVSVALAGQGFGYELLNTLLGTNNQACNACCEPQACQPACCEKACPPACCEKACPPVCKPACDPCQPACEPNCCQPCCKPRCDLFAGLKGLFACKKCCAKPCCCEPCGTACCEPKCCPEPQCCEKSCVPACDPCAPACDPCAPACDDCGTCGTCCSKLRHCTPVRDLIEDLCSLRICVYKAPRCCHKACGSCCETNCCEPNCCEPACGGCGNGGQTAPATAPKEVEPAKSLPDAPDDESAMVRPAKIYRASRSVVRN